MVLRLYLFARYMRSASTLYSHWVAFIGTLNDVNAMRPFFHFKALFKIQPLHLLVPLALLNTLLTAAILRILESPVQAAFENYGKCVWLTAVTLVRLYACAWAGRRAGVKLPSLTLTHVLPVVWTGSLLLLHSQRQGSVTTTP